MESGKAIPWSIERDDTHAEVRCSFGPFGSFYSTTRQAMEIDYRPLRSQIAIEGESYMTAVGKRVYLVVSAMVIRCTGIAKASFP
jgi:hypothetical protein